MSGRFHLNHRIPLTESIMNTDSTILEYVMSKQTSLVLSITSDNTFCKGNITKQMQPMTCLLEERYCYSLLKLGNSDEKEKKKKKLVGMVQEYIIQMLPLSHLLNLRFEDQSLGHFKVTFCRTFSLCKNYNWTLHHCNLYCKQFKQPMQSKF